MAWETKGFGVHLQLTLRWLFAACIGAGVFALLSSCAAPNVKPNYSMLSAKNEGHGVLVGVITADTQPTTFSFDARFFFDPKDNQQIAFHYVQLNTDCSTSDIGNVKSDESCTHVFAVDLPSGQYTFGFWRVFGNGFFPYSIDPLIWLPQQFSIVPGKATYIGHIYMHIKYEHSKIGQNARDAWPEVKDQLDTDMPLLSKFYPFLNMNQIVYDVLVFPPRGKTIICPCP